MTGGACIFGCEGLTLSDEEARFFRDADPFGFILFARNIDTPDQVRRLTAALRAAVGREAPVLVDQEGGRVQRLRAPTWRDWVAPLDEVARASDPVRAMFLRYALIGAELRGVGIDVNCAPIADVADDRTHPFLRNRCYGEDADQVAQIARAVADGLLHAGVLPVIKHIPGHGRGQVDSHKDLPRVAVERAALERDFAPFHALNDLPMGMSAHVVYEAIDPAAPATTSAKMIRVIREEIGFAGLLMTDDLSMEALDGTPAARVAASLAAGIDVILHCNGDLAEMQAVAAQAGALTQAAQARAAAALQTRPGATEIDIPALEAEFSGLTSGPAHV
ncbi:MAG: glycoside hydrolase family 3 N-terminal domain-containing protein [Pseudomonadota bacterium]